MFLIKRTISNRAASIRKGFGYQDLWAVKLCCEWILRPEDFKSLQVEADVVGGNSDYLDDIKLLDKGDQYHSYQLKFKQNKDYEWNWDELTKTSKKRRQSLLKKWSSSIKHTKIGKLVTNGSASEEVKKYLSNDKINIKKLKNDAPEIFAKIETEIDGDTNDFFEKFEFHFEHKSLEDFKKEVIEDLFIKKLKSTDDGANNLLIKLIEESHRETTRQITIDEILKWCKFDNPKPLNEKFNIPGDFEFFDEVTHTELLAELANTDGGIKIIHGKPGTGKSVYLSKLCEELKEKKFPVIKHHYHINPAEENPMERLNFERVEEAIKAELKNSNNISKKYIGELGQQDSKNISLREFITKIASSLREDKKSLVIVIDGLDHVTREGDRTDLENFLREIFYPQKGLWIIFGTQPQVLNMPELKSIFNKCKTVDRIEVKGLNQRSVYEIAVHKNEVSLNLPSERQALNAFSDALYRVTEGVPLHLRYSLNHLKTSLGTTQLTLHDCDNLVPYNGNIEEYYKKLWDDLSEDSKTFLLTLVSVDFKFTKAQLIEAIAPWTKSPTIISQSFNQVEHLIINDKWGRLRLYHNSFRVFLLEQKEWDEQKRKIQEGIKKWLESSPYEHLKWAELRKLTYSLGDKASILEIDRNWLIDASVYPRNLNEIESQLSLSTQAAFECKDFSKTLKIAHLSTYYKNFTDDGEENYTPSLEESILLNPEVIDNLKLDEFPSKILVRIAALYFEKGNTERVEEIREILENRHTFQEYREGQIPPITKALLQIDPYLSWRTTEQTYKYIKQFEDLKITESLFGIFSERLSKLGQIEKLKELLKMGLSRSEMDAILDNALIYDLDDKKKEFISYYKGHSLFAEVFLFLNKKKMGKLPALPAYSDFPSTLPEHGPERSEWAEKFESLFWTAVLYGINKQEGVLKNWINKSPSLWPIKTACTLFKKGLLTNEYLKKEKVDYESLFENTDKLPNLTWPEDRDSIEFKFAYTQALSSILKKLIKLKEFLEGQVEIEAKVYKTIKNSDFFSYKNLVELTNQTEIAFCSSDVYEEITSELVKDLNEQVGTYSERTRELLTICRFARLHKDRNARKYLRSAVDNALGYSYHKDVYLFDVLESIEFCVNAGLDTKKIKNWVDGLIPLMIEVVNFTDGDETHYLPLCLAEFLAKYDKNLLYKFYNYLSVKEELYDAQEIFRAVIKSLDFSISVDSTLGTTGLDKESLNRLKEIAEKDKDAEKALKEVTDYFGSTNYKEDSGNSGFTSKKADYSKTKLKNLDDKLKKIDNRWDRDRYLAGWLEYWSLKLDKKALKDLIESKIIIDGKEKEFIGEVLDVIYPIVFGYDQQKAFDLICYAQSNDHGWARYWTDRKKAESRWNFIQKNFPKRYLEFFEKSLLHGTGVGQRGELGMPLCKAVEFMVKFGNLDKAEEITNASIEFVYELMADQKIPKPQWLENGYPTVDILDLLFERLIWASPLVRERAATGIAKLIAHEKNNQEIYKRLLKWINRWKLESVIAIGILPIVKALQLCSKPTSLSFIKTNEIAGAIKANSVVIEELINEIANLNKDKLSQTIEFIEALDPPNDYEPEKTFYKYIKSTLAPIYHARALEIEKRTHQQFIRIWAYNAQLMAKEDGIELNFNIGFYGHTATGEFLLGFSTKVSEVYRSSFIRTVESFYEKGLIPKDFYLEYTFATLPIDLSYWKIKPNRAPSWWPKLKECSKKEKGVSLDSLEFDKKIDDLIRIRNENNLIIAAEGAIEPSSGWSDSPKHSFALFGFLYKVIGPELPLAEEVSKKIIHGPLLTLIPSSAENPLSYLENTSCLGINDKEFQIKDLVIKPIIGRNNDLTISMWQYFRDKNLAFNLTEEVKNSLKISIEGHCWKYTNERGKTCFIFEDFLEGLQERYPVEMPIPHGQFVSMAEVSKTEFEKEGWRLGYLLETTYGIQKYSYEEAKKFIDYKFLNLSSIIIS